MVALFQHLGNQFGAEVWEGGLAAGGSSSAGAPAQVRTGEAGLGGVAGQRQTDTSSQDVCTVPLSCRPINHTVCSPAS